MLDLGFPQMPPEFKAFGTFVLVVMGLIWAANIANAIKLRKSGINPLTATADIANRVLASEMLSPAVSTEERLAEIDRLFANGTISAEEHKAARVAAISGK